MLLIPFEIPKTPYEWGVFDCFTLADHIRFNLDGTHLPDISWVYSKFTEVTQPKNLIDIVVDFHCDQVVELATGCLVILKVNGVSNLGTVYKDTVIYMGASRATWQPVERMSEYLDSVWEYSRKF